MNRILRTLAASALLATLSVGAAEADQPDAGYSDAGYFAYAVIGDDVRPVAPGDVIAVGTPNGDGTCRFGAAPKVGVDIPESSETSGVGIDVVLEGCTMRVSSIRAGTDVNAAVDAVVDPALAVVDAAVDVLFNTAKPPIRHRKAKTTFSVYDGVGGAFDGVISETILVSSWDVQGSRAFNGAVDAKACNGYGSFKGYVARVKPITCSSAVYDREPPWTSLRGEFERELVLPFVGNPVLDEWTQRTWFQATANGFSASCDFSETSPPSASSWSCNTKKV